MLTISPELLDSLKAQYPGQLLLLAAGTGEERIEIAARRLTKDEWQEDVLDFLAAADSDVAEWALRRCRLFPTAEELETILNDQPAMADAWGQQILDATGYLAPIKVRANKLKRTATMTAIVMGERVEIPATFPTRAHWKQVRALFTKGVAGIFEAHSFAFGACCSLDEGAKKAIAEKYPALPSAFGKEICSLAGSATLESPKGF